MKMHRIFAFAAVAAAVSSILMAGRAGGFPIPGIPGIPGIDPQTVAINAAIKQMAPWVRANQPILLDWSALYPNTNTLPGAPFAPASDAASVARIRQLIQGQLAHSSTGIVNLPPGDYAFETRVYCTDIHRHGGSRALWLMGPLRGTRGNLLAAMYARASGKNVDFHQLQSLSWAMQAGMRYDELPPASRQLFDALIPDFRALAAGSFIEQVQGQWKTLSSTIPGLPSMDSAIGRMGDVGQTIFNIRNARDTILANADNYHVVASTLAPPSQSGPDTSGYPPPWAQVGPGVYESVKTPGHYGDTSEFDIRVTGPGQAGVPFSSVISYAPSHPEWQPLTQDSPTFSGKWSDIPPRQ
jgi:hypothetical protein